MSKGTLEIFRGWFAKYININSTVNSEPFRDPTPNVSKVKSLIPGKTDFSYCAPVANLIYCTSCCFKMEFLLLKIIDKALCENICILIWYFRLIVILTYSLYTTCNRFLKDCLHFPLTILKLLMCSHPCRRTVWEIMYEKLILVISLTRNIL